MTFLPFSEDGELVFMISVIWEGREGKRREGGEREEMEGEEREREREREKFNNKQVYSSLSMLTKQNDK